jgi:hypothetical protein
MALHIQDDVRIVRPTGNLFLTNIHRVYLGEVTECYVFRYLSRRTAFYPTVIRRDLENGFL